jgi:hypothetical protein
MKIRLVGAEFFHAGRWTDGQTNMTKLTATSRSLANAPNKSMKCVIVGVEGYCCT